MIPHQNYGYWVTKGSRESYKNNTFPHNTTVELVCQFGFKLTGKRRYYTCLNGFSEGSAYCKGSLIIIWCYKKVLQGQYIAELKLWEKMSVFVRGQVKWPIVIQICLTDSGTRKTKSFLYIIKKWPNHWVKSAKRWLKMLSSVSGWVNTETILVYFVVEMWDQMSLFWWVW